MKRNPNKLKTAALLASILLLITGVSACSPKPEPDSQISSQVEDPAVFPDGTSIGGKNISGKTVDEALETARKALQETVDGLEISVKFRDDTVVLSKSDFVTKDVLELTLPKLLESRRADKYELAYVTDLSESGRQKLTDAAAACYAEGKNATVTGFDSDAGAFIFSDEQKGSRVDLVKTLASVRQLLSQKHSGAIQAAFLEANPTLTKETLSKNFKLMASYTTESGNTENGNSNMRLALSHVNGTVLEPGQVFSYNDTIGDSTNPENGWLPAGGLSGGVLVQMYGGGICQGSSTLYNAVLRAGLEIVERDCHSSPSSYCPIGLDATVDYGNIDFKFRNQLDPPVYLSAWMDGVTLHVNVYGCFPSEWDRVEVSSEQVGYEPPRSEVSFVTDYDLAAGEYVRKTSGNEGYSACAYRTYYKGDTVVKSEQLPDSYYEPTGTVYAVGEGTDTSKVDTSKERGTTTKEKPSPEPSKSPETPSKPPVNPDPPEESSEQPPESPEPTEEPPESSELSSESNSSEFSSSNPEEGADDVDSAAE